MKNKVRPIELVSDSTMNIHPLEGVTLKELVDGFRDESETTGGVFGWGGKLIIRPDFQRSYVVEDNLAWKAALINSVVNNRPTGVMYFGKSPKKVYLNVDGQQRLITLLDFMTSGFAVPMMDKSGVAVERRFAQLPKEYQDRINNYKPQINVCEGDDDKILEWFITINQPTQSLTPQELKNATYICDFVEDAKQIFSMVKNNGITVKNQDIMYEESPYFYGYYTNKDCNPCRQEVLEMVLDWVSYRDFHMCTGFDMDDRISSYMSLHKDMGTPDASDVVNYYKEVVDCIRDVFFHNKTDKQFFKSIKPQKSTKIPEWHKLYVAYKDVLTSLSEDDKIEITKRCDDMKAMGCDNGGVWMSTVGIYEYVLYCHINSKGLSPNEIETLEIDAEHRFLQKRTFSKGDKEHQYLLQGGKDPIDGKTYELKDMHAHHIKSWRSGGKTIPSNMILLSKENHEKYHCGDFGYTPDDLKRLLSDLKKQVEAEDTI